MTKFRVSYYLYLGFLCKYPKKKIISFPPEAFVSFPKR